MVMVGRGGTTTRTRVKLLIKESETEHRCILYTHTATTHGAPTHAQWQTPLSHTHTHTHKHIYSHIRAHCHNWTLLIFPVKGR